jgi:hypothetical protein
MNVSYIVYSGGPGLVSSDPVSSLLDTPPPLQLPLHLLHLLRDLPPPVCNCRPPSARVQIILQSLLSIGRRSRLLNYIFELVLSNFVLFTALEGKSSFVAKAYMFVVNAKSCCVIFLLIWACYCPN